MPPKIPLPRRWNRRAKSAILHILALSHHTLIYPRTLANDDPRGIDSAGGHGSIMLAGSIRPIIQRCPGNNPFATNERRGENAGEPGPPGDAKTRRKPFWFAERTISEARHTWAV